MRKSELTRVDEIGFEIAIPEKPPDKARPNPLAKWRVFADA
jgi:hypothetical protein